MSMFKRIIKSIIALLIVVTSLSYSWIEVKADDENSIAYAILTDENDLIFFRSIEQYSEGSNTTVTDLITVLSMAL